MAKSHWLINSNKTEVKRFIKNDKSIDGVFEYMFVDTGKIVGVFGKNPPVMTTTVSVEMVQLEKSMKDYFLRVGEKLKRFGKKRLNHLFQFSIDNKTTIIIN